MKFRRTREDDQLDCRWCYAGLAVLSALVFGFVAFELTRITMYVWSNP